MSNIEKLSKIIAAGISKNISMDSDKEEVIAYGAFIFMQTIISILMVVVFGIVFNVLLEALIISFASATLRKFSGGAHATSPVSCAIIGMIVFGLLAILVKHCIINLDFLFIAIVMILCFVFTYYIMYKYSPVGTENKPLNNENKRKRLKEKSIKLIVYLFIANISLIILYVQTRQILLLNIAICITVGIVWQSVTLVSLGHNIIYMMDKIIRCTTKIIRRTNHEKNGS